MRGVREANAEFEVRLDNRKVFLLGFTVLVLVVLAFAVGYVVGRRSGWITAGEGTVSVVEPPDGPVTPVPLAIAPPPVTPVPPPAASPALPDIPAIPATAPVMPAATRTRTATPSPKGKAATEVPARRGWSVQVGAYGERSQANAVAGELRAKGKPVFVVEPGKGESRQLWRVRVGPFTTKGAAEAAAASLKKEGIREPLVREE
jgi:cell division septation protein DedD